MMEILMLIIIIGFYFLPTITGRDKTNIISIFVVNLFLGWTLIGWVVALSWACINEENVDNAHKALTALKKQKDKLDLGLITESEYDLKKQQYINLYQKPITTGISQSKNKNVVKLTTLEKGLLAFAITAIVILLLVHIITGQ